MRILVSPHELSIGGSQINAIDLAASMIEAGHEAIIYGVRGPLVSYIEELGVPFIAARELRYRPAPSRIAQLTSIARRERIDIIHAYEWPPCLDAYFGAHLLGHTPLVCTVLSMAVSPLVPPSIPLIMGTAQLGDVARSTGRPGPTWVIEPPIDTVEFAPGHDGSEFRRAHGVDDSETLVVSVSRLAIDLKLDSLVRAIDAVDELADRLPVRLVIVGDGEAREMLQQRADQVNDRAGRTVVSLPGSTLEPRGAYAAADVVVSMGSSALRAMSMGRAVIVQGEEGFSEILDADSLAHVLWEGAYGIGDGEPGAARLAGQIELLARHPELREANGRFGRRVIEEHFSLPILTERLLGIFDEVLERAGRPASSVGARLGEAIGMGARAAGNELDMHRPGQKAQRQRSRHDRLVAAGASR